MSAFLVLTVLQGILIFVDEVFFHHKRGLPRWERIGHPLDTATVLSCLLFIGLAPKNVTNETIYYSMAIFSCVFITKDEWVHRKFCSAMEMWLHALLFVVHPLLLFSAVYVWESHQQMVLMTAAGVVVFGVYQVVYWNFIDYRLQERRRAALYRDLSQEDRYDYFRE
ncbi:hypothetical protein [Bdellovibrio sp. KM01]|uniref:hypothetical protein n=1 Tax=Bdellovibrio sp. KM01 TaxID=2748865 RepID=UPI0015EA3D8E|nr:hypothetical protein [Bdellovibrio sp. KM01]QLY25786.1 hypothetical protein HW988_01695 [Bdellovibrio sp. KM01]